MCPQVFYWFYIKIYIDVRICIRLVKIVIYSIDNFTDEILDFF